MPLFGDGHDIEHLSLVGSAGGTVSGRVVSEDGTLPKDIGDLFAGGGDLP